MSRQGIGKAEFEPAMVNNPLFVYVRDDAGEERWYALGATGNLRVVFLVFTFLAGRIRPITGWAASKKLREGHFKRKLN